MRRILRDLKILILANLWIVPVLAGLVGALFYFVAPPPPMHARMATGAVGGGYVGHKVEERTRTQTVYQIAVRMEDGSVRRFTRAQPTAVGTPVVLQGKGFRVDDGAAMRAEEPYPRAQPGAERVADTY